MFEDLANLKLKKLDKYLFLEDPENWKQIWIVFFANLRWLRRFCCLQLVADLS